MKRTVVAVLALCSMALSGCAAVALTALGVGMATGVSHTLGGMVYKTFTTPQAQVKRATLGAFSRMQVKVVQAKRDGSTETIIGRAGDREIEVELESLTPATTRMKVTAKQNGGLLRDGATATEVILQTERIVGT
jgi:predicted small secreted protein